MPTNLRANFRCYNFVSLVHVETLDFLTMLQEALPIDMDSVITKLGKTGNEFTFNPITKQEEERSQPKGDFLVLRHCPYCGRRYEQPTLS